MKDTMEPGWYIPLGEKHGADIDPWNPYFRYPDGTWIEAQSVGHVEVRFPEDIVWPLAAVAAGTRYEEPTRGSAQS